MGLIGKDISYTLSPLLHNTALTELGVNAVYLPFSLNESAVKQILDFSWEAGAIGFNVTKPFKILAASLVESQGRSSINTIFRGDSGWLGTSTDGVGFLAGLKQIGRTIEDFDEVVFLGAGGAVLGILQHLQEVAPSLSVTVLRRRLAVDPEVKSASGAIKTKLVPFTVECFADILSDSCRSLLIQASDAPRSGDDLRGFLPAFKKFKGSFVDLIYGNQISALYGVAREKGLPASDGLPMLIEQARAAQKIWFGQAPSYESLAMKVCTMLQ